MSKTIIDVDTGTDDAIALVVALNSPELDIAAITTVGGNATLEDTTRNTLWLLDYMGRADIPLHVGAARPLDGEFGYAYHYHGERGLVGLDADPPSHLAPASTNAAAAIADACRESDGEATVIALGPLTNIAQAILEESLLPSQTRRIVVMGGAVEVGGNVTPRAEFNIHSDPRAANVVLSSGIPIELVGLDVVKEGGFHRSGGAWRSDGSRGKALTKRLVEGWFEIHEGDVYALCDPLTIVAAIRPELFEWRDASVTVDERGDAIGATRAAYDGGGVRVALDVDANEARDFALGRIV